MRHMTYLSRLLNENYVTTLDLGNETVEVFQNPDSLELQQCMGKQYPDCRGLVMADTGDLYIWSYSLNEETPGSLVAHGPVIKKMDWESRPFIPIVLDQRENEIYVSTWELGQSPIKMKMPEIIKYLATNKEVLATGLKPPQS